ncbi:MAG: hypothetical protein LBD12_07350, partial [Clostridiales Family XIII bacterium]|nr:hypothetical protein [Clostridiales Family XIII bacterium]
MKYVSTRGASEGLRSAQAIIQGLAGDKGLYVPAELPSIGSRLRNILFSAYNVGGAEQSPDILTGMGLRTDGRTPPEREASYASVAYQTLRLFFDDFTEEELHRSVLGAYDDKFDHRKIAPLVSAGGVHFLELYHGRTAAFKDMALSILPYLLLSAMRRENEDRKIVILTATSGDTGKAALEGFADVSGTEIFVFYPKGGVSGIQERQMVTQLGGNTHVFAVEGNFDDAQTAVKRIFGDESFAASLEAEGCRLSSANSINIGRLVPQIAYYL